MSVQVMQELNFVTWYTERELFYCPMHFVKAATVVTDESLAWIHEKLYGRFYISDHHMDLSAVYFEDPQEAVFYELVWS